MGLNVIWIDDECKKQDFFTKSFVTRCEKRHGISIESFELAIDGISRLEHNLDHFQFLRYKPVS